MKINQLVVREIEAILVIYKGTYTFYDKTCENTVTYKTAFNSTLVKD
jgi:hypothetical protein